MSNLLSIFDLTSGEIWKIIELARALKSSKAGLANLSGKSLGLIFEKPSTRTSVSFSVAMYQLKGFPLMLDARNLQTKRGETIKDTSKTLSRYLDGVVIRAFQHGEVEKFANASDIPVINGLTDKEHPCQILGDILTLVEKKGIKKPGALKDLKIAFIGDGNNVANSLMGACALLGMKFFLAGPKGYEPDREITDLSSKAARHSGGSVTLTRSAQDACRNADVIYTDVWTSMGEESEANERIRAFKPFQVNKNLLKFAKSDCLVMHCLPAHRGEEITADVIDGPKSVVFDEAENRLHIQKAILLYLLR